MAVNVFQKRSFDVLAVHPQATLIALGQTNRVRLWDNKLESIGTLVCDDQVSAVDFQPQGKLLATSCYRGKIFVYEVDENIANLPVLLHDSCSLDQNLYPDPQECGARINALKFHPNGQLLAIASHHGFIQLKDLDGNRLVQLDQHAVVKDLAFTPAGLGLVAVGGNFSQVVEGKDHAAVVWKQHQNPTLEQLLMRQVLKNYLQACRVLCIEPEVPVGKDDLVPWMVERFNLDQDELKETWQSMPEKLQASIVRTLIYRASLIPHDQK